MINRFVLFDVYYSLLNRTIRRVPKAKTDLRAKIHVVFVFLRGITDSGLGCHRYFGLLLYLTVMLPGMIYEKEIFLSDNFFKPILFTGFLIITGIKSILHSP